MQNLTLVIGGGTPQSPDIPAALATLRSRQYDVRVEPDLRAGLAALAERRCFAILLHLALPDSSGLPTLLRVQTRSGTTPIIAIVDRTQEALGEEAVRRGALDYLMREEITAPLIDKVLRLALERTHTVLALRASEARYRTMFESTSAGVYQAAADGRLISANPAFARLLEYEREDELLALDLALDIYANAEDFEQWKRELEEEGEIRARETVLRRRGGERIVVLQSARLVRDSRGAPLYYEGSVADVTDSHRQARQWSYEASHDALTGLLNRRELERRLQTVVENAAIDGSSVAALMIDLDAFKAINDRCGHAAGDEVLRHVASILRNTTRGGDLVARYGGDEFVVLLEHCSEEDAQRIAGNVVKALETEACLWAGQQLDVRASVGLALATGPALTAGALLEQADTACYSAKAQGGKRVQSYRPNLTSAVKLGRERQALMRLEQALESGELRLTAQRIAPLRKERAVRALCELRLALPDDLTEVAGALLAAPDRVALASRIERWSLRTACQWLRQHAGRFERIERWFVNFSAALEDANASSYVLATLRETGAPPERLGFEIPESILTARMPAVLAFIQRLAPLGVQFTLDEFGRGISSFMLLKSAPVTYVKLDAGAFLEGPESAAALALMQSLHQINDTFGKRTIVEGVGDAELLARLGEAQVDFAQGEAVGSARLLTDLAPLPRSVGRTAAERRK